MNTILRTKLAQLPALDRANAVRAAIPCKVCGEAAPFFDVVDFNKTGGLYQFGPSGVPVPWHRCDMCDFLFTPFFDDWESDDFARYVYNSDYIKVDPEYLGIRAEADAVKMIRLLAGHEHVRLLDYGSGQGFLAKRMSENGFQHAASYDPFSSPRRPAGQFDVITCFEVIEHSPNPRQTIADMIEFLAPGGCIIMGEGLQPPDIDILRANWWYCAPRNGHCSTFSRFGLSHLAQKFGLVLHCGHSQHVMRPHTASADIANRIAPVLVSAMLTAPSSSEPGWHGLETTNGTAFRWSEAQSLTWSIAVPTGKIGIEFRIPFAHEARRGFAAECSITVDGIDLPVTARQRSLSVSAEINAAADVVTVALHTPPPFCPASNGSPDARRLGLAIVTG